MPKKILLKGRVQGVGCRGYCAKYARQYGIKGSATNLSNGSVKLILDCKESTMLKDYINSLIQNPDRYPFFGKITGIEVSECTGNINGDYMF